MGALLTTRQQEGIEEVDVGPNHVYKYPPRSGNYFGSHFIMGGERFDTPQPDFHIYLRSPNEPTLTLRSLVNIRKESLRFVRVVNEYNKLNLETSESRDVESGSGTSFNIEFTFDCDVECAITIYYFCTEEVSPTGVMYTSRDPSLNSETFRYSKGANQVFSQASHVFNPAKMPDEELLYDVDREVIPVAIHCVVDEGPEELRQSHTTIAIVEKVTDGTYLLKALKQKLFVDGLCYLLQEIYGIENKSCDKMDDDETEDNGSECVICMCDVRDTLILPCRHLCLCNSCADSLRYQANNCPICRAPFRALLQIRALQKCGNSSLAPISVPEGTCDNIPPGYEAISLIEALNGPSRPPRHPPNVMPDLVETPDNENAIQAALVLNRQCDRSTPPKNRCSDKASPEYNVTVLMTHRREEDCSKETTQCPLLSEGKSSKKTRSRDSVILINERIETYENVDEDSETERMSPLLQKIVSPNNVNSLALNMADVVDPIDDGDTDQEDQPSTSARDRSKNYSERGDESDYYTPDEPTPTTGAMYEAGPSSSADSTPQRLPGTPHSHSSIRSSSDSYSSGSSTRQLLTIVKTGANGSNDKSVDV
ncbi:hypothetical protein NQ317_019037 [Molorchus minor]|uniref:RING-type E3 ubiquitin transferase n=1 Tax=Molorchus minor TaxID=1323400 RepID=A0ABQ9IRY8_9CUCU|nr:hypothetical protein NQ317_019037 [Molorchus minor]